MIVFEDLPSTDTPINTDNLNNMQTLQIAKVITSATIA